MDARVLAIFVLSSVVCLEGRLGRARWIGDGLLLREKEVCLEFVVKLLISQ